MLTEFEEKVLASVQDDLPLVARPYLELADKLGISEKTFLTTLADLCQRGVIRRFGATLRHQKSGFTANAMGAWQVDEARIDDVGHLMAANPAISHCYRRSPAPGWSYNLYTMIHARHTADCHAIARQLAEAAQVTQYTLLFSRQELKKTSMEYFPDDE